MITWDWILRDEWVKVMIKIDRNNELIGVRGLKNRLYKEWRLYHCINSINREYKKIIK